MGFLTDGGQWTVMGIKCLNSFKLFKVPSGLEHCFWYIQSEFYRREDNDGSEHEL